MPALPSGTILNKRYEIIEFIDRGSFGETYTARDTNPDTKNKNPGFLCVVKRLQPQATDDWSMQEARRLFKREAEVLERLPNYRYIPKFVDRFIETLDDIEDFYIVYEWINGQPLSTEVKPNEPLSEEKVLELLQTLLTIIDFLHRNQVFHRDIKPENIIVREPDRKLVLIDFGSVKDISARDRDRNSPTEISTADYTPLEQQYGQPHPSHDIYALGMTAIEVLTGTKPKTFRNPNGSVDWHNYTAFKNDRLIAIIDKMVHPKFSERYMSAGEALHDLKLLKIEVQSVEQDAWQRSTSFLDSINDLLGTRKLAFLFGISLFVLTFTVSLLRSNLLDSFKPCQNFMISEKLDASPKRCLENPKYKPKFAYFYTKRGDKFYKEEKFQEALADYKRANELSLKNSTILTEIGDASYKLYRFKEGDEAYRQATLAEPESASEWNSRGDAFFNLNKLEQARVDYRKAIQEEISDSEFWTDLGDVLYKLDRDQDALEAYGEALKLEPKEQVRVWNGKGKALIGLNKLDEALQAFEKVQAIDPEDLTAWYHKGIVWDKQGKTRDARIAYETVIDKCDRILERKPGSLEALSQKADALGKLKKHKQAIDILKPIAQQYPTYFLAQSYLANQLFFDGQYDAALEAIDRAIENVPEWQQPEVWVNKGTFLIGRPGEDIVDKLKAAVDAFTQALKIDPKFPPALQYRGQAFMDLGQFQEALNDFDLAIQVENPDSKLLILQGAALSALGRNEEALKSIESGIKLNESDPVAWWQYGVVLEKQNRDRLALSAYDRAIELDRTYQQAIDARRQLQEKDQDKTNPASGEGVLEQQKDTTSTQGSNNEMPSQPKMQLHPTSEVNPSIPPE